jgi:DNA-binding transcriptional LysR family regulator
MLDVMRLQVLVELAEAGSIAGSAKALGYTPSAVSQQLAKLEREVGARLATRTRSGVELTPEGQVLAERAKMILKELEAAKQAVADVGQLRRGSVRVGSFTSAARTMIAPAITRIREEHPGLRLSLADTEPPDGYDAVLAGHLDLLISHTYPGIRAPETAGLVRTQLMNDALVAVVPVKEARRFGKGPIPLERLAESMPLISGRPGDAHRIALDHAYARLSLRPDIEFETRDYAVTLALAASGAGAAIVPRSLLRRPDPEIRVFATEPGYHRKIFALYRVTSRDPALTAILSYLQEAAAALIA